MDTDCVLCELVNCFCTCNLDQCQSPGLALAQVLSRRHLTLEARVGSRLVYVRFVLDRVAPEHGIVLDRVAPEHGTVLDRVAPEHGIVLDRLAPEHGFMLDRVAPEHGIVLDRVAPEHGFRFVLCLAF